MKFIAATLFSILVYLPAHARVSDADFTAITAYHQEHTQKPATYKRVEDGILATDNGVFLVMTGAELKKEGTKAALFAAFRTNPNITLLLDFSPNDGFLDGQGSLSLEVQDVPINITNVYVLDRGQKVQKIADGFLSFQSNQSLLQTVSFGPMLQLTSIGDSFLSCCHLTHFNGSTWTQLTSIGDKFLEGCSRLTQLDGSTWTQLKSIGKLFLHNCWALTHLDGSTWVQLTSIGNCFLCDCGSLTYLDGSGWTQLTTIGNDFLWCCIALTHLDGSTWTQLTSIGDNFLHYCTALTHLDGSGWTRLTSIGYYFLYACRALTHIDVSGWTQVTSLGGCFLSGDINNACLNLTHIHKPELTPLFVLKKIVDHLRNSNNPAQQEVGAALYQAYLLNIDPRLQPLLDELKLETWRALTSNPLPDLPLNNQDMPGLFESLWGDLHKTEHQPTLGEHATYFHDHFMPQLNNLFVDPEIAVTWSIRDEYRPEMKIAFKHIITKLQSLMHNKAGQAEAVSYLMLMMQAFAHCESRYVSATNQVLMQMGLSLQAEAGTRGQIVQMLNELKNEAYMDMRSNDDNDGAHTEGRHFTVVNNAIGLPVAIRSFKEKISRLSDDEMQEILLNFIGGWFNKTAIIQAMQQKLLKNDKLTPARLRGFLCQIEDPKILTQYNQDDDDDDAGIEAYYRSVAKLSNNEAFDYKTTPFSIGEIERLLTRMDVFVDRLKSTATSSSSKRLTVTLAQNASPQLPYYIRTNDVAACYGKMATANWYRAPLKLDVSGWTKGIHTIIATPSGKSRQEIIIIDTVFDGGVIKIDNEGQNVRITSSDRSISIKACDKEGAVISNLVGLQEDIRSFPAPYGEISLEITVPGKKIIKVNYKHNPVL